MFLEGIGEILCHAVPEHDRVGDLHHRALQMQREQRVVGFGGSDLLRIEFPQCRHVQDRAIDNFARGQREFLLEDFHRAGGIGEFDARLCGGAHRHGFLGAEEILAAHVGDTRHRAGLRPGLHHLMWMLLREGFHGRRKRAGRNCLRATRDSRLSPGPRQTGPAPRAPHP